MTNPLSVAARYRAAYYGGHYEALRDLLADDLVVTGPAASYRGVEKFLKASEHVAPLVKAVEVRREFADGDDVCAVLTLVVHPPGEPAPQRLPLVEWYRFEAGRIASIETFFDTGPFVRRSAKAGHSAVDPVCHMRVEPTTAATREHDGRTYHFCSEGCAIAFADAPDRYLAPPGA